MWPEVQKVIDENKRELCLHGSEIAGRIDENGLDLNIMKITNLNLLRVSETSLAAIPDEISNLVNLQKLMLYGNSIKSIPENVKKLEKLNYLDLSHNQIETLPVGVQELKNLTTLNLSNNNIKEVVQLQRLPKLMTLDLSFNSIESFDPLCTLNNIIEINLKANNIVAIPEDISLLINLKQLNLSVNQIKQIPKILASMSKLKDVDLAENPIEDKRLLKLVKQCRTKQILDYVKMHGTESISPNPDKTEQNVEKKLGQLAVKEQVPNKKICVERYADDSMKIIYDDIVKDLRPFILSCVVKDVTFTVETLKRFLQMQTKLDDTVCAHREKATIATHDLKKVKGPVTKYTAKPPSDLLIFPLGKSAQITGAALYKNLKAEASAYRKEKKRNTFSSIHKYLYMLEKKTTFSCLEDSEKNIISLHPLTNSEISKIDVNTKNIFIEVTSGISMTICRTTIETLLFEMLNLGIGNDSNEVQNDSKKMTIQQVRITDAEGNLRTVYPSKTDLNFDDVVIERK